MRYGVNLFRKREKLSGFKYYKDLDTLPIWNWYKLHEKGDLKYLLIDIDYNDKIRTTVKFYKELKQTYNQLIEQFDNLDISVLRAKARYQVKLMQLIKEIAKSSTDPKKLDRAFNITLALLATDKPISDWLFKVDFTENQEQRSYLTDIALAINDYNTEVKKHDTKQSLIEKTVKIETVLNVQIDVKTCSVNKYKEYEKLTIEKMTAWHKANK